MKYRYLSWIVVSSTASMVAGCAMDTAAPSEALRSEQSASTTCAPLSSTQSSQRTAASVAVQLLRLAAPQDTTSGGSTPAAAWSILASQRYRVQKSGTGIEFDPTDNLYLGGYVTSAMQAALALPQEQDATFAAFLSNGLKAAWANTNGLVYPAFLGVGALNGYNGKGPTTSYVSCSTCNNWGNDAYGVTITTVAGACGTQVLNFAETVYADYQYAPILAQSVYGGLGWRTGTLPAFKGSNNVPSMPFNGPSGNPYLVVSIDGSPVNWSNPSSFSGINCDANAKHVCTGSIQIDPAPYFEPGSQFDVNSNLLGTQANPFIIDSNLILADSTHATQWATRWVNGVEQWGTFSQPITRGGVTYYLFVAKY